MDLNYYNQMTSSEVEIIAKMNDNDLTSTIVSDELNRGFSAPSSSLDTCDSGFTDLYSNNFTLINSTNNKIGHAKTSPLANAKLKESTSTSRININIIDKLVVDSKEQQPEIDTNKCDDELPIDEEQLDILNSLESNGSTAESSCTENVKISKFNDSLLDDYNDDSNASDLSDLSDVFKLNSDILPEMQRSINWVHLQIASGVNPRDCLSKLFINSPKSSIPRNISDNDLWRVIAAILSDPPQRQCLQHIQTIENVCDTIKKSKNIIVLTGAGVSVSCGIPDFRSRDGIYERLRIEYPDMRDPQSMFDIGYFAKDPRPFYQFAKEIYPGLFEPSLSHRFIKLLERKGKLLRNYTQNIDTLERVAGIENVIECHGSFATASCTRCKYTVEASDIKDDILSQRIPMCKICNVESTKETNEYGDEISLRLAHPLNYGQLVTAGVMKPDIVFFGESLPDKFHTTIELDKSNCDLLIVIGSSLKVRPVALIPSSINSEIPQILINREQLDHFTFDVELLGDSDVIINQLCHILGDEWNDICVDPPLNSTNEILTNPNMYNMPKFFASAVIRAPETNKDGSIDGETSTAIQSSLDESTDISELSQSSAPAIESNSMESISNESEPSTSNTQSKKSKAREDMQTLADFLPDKTYFYNSKNCYIFPGAEIWWNKDSDNDSTSSDSSAYDDDDDIDIEIDNIKNDMEQSCQSLEDIQTKAINKEILSSSTNSTDLELKQMHCGNDQTTEISTKTTSAHYNSLTITSATITNTENSHKTITASETNIKTTTNHEFNKYILKRSADTTLDHTELKDEIVNFENPQKRQKHSVVSTVAEDN